MVPVATDIRLFNRDAVHHLLHHMRPVRVLRRILGVAGDEHTHNNHKRRYRGRQNRGCRILVVIVQFGYEHAHDDVQAFERPDCEAWEC